MTKFAEMKRQCEKARSEPLDVDVDGFDLCCVQSGLICTGDSCPSKKFWNKTHRQPGYYKQRALERTGLTEEYEEEMHD